MTSECWMCGHVDTVYTDVLDLDWCETCFTDIYLAPRDGSVCG